MKPGRSTLVILVCLVILLFLAGAVEVFIQDGISSGSLLAAVKKATTTKTTPVKKPAVKAPVINVFSRNKEPYLNLSSPYFNFITILSAPTPITTLEVLKVPESIFKPNDILTITAPTPIVPVTNIEHSLVNIFCSQRIGNARKVVTGSGVLIKDGIVLTDAHVAVYPLVADSNAAMSCIARTGSPAVATHSVKVAFISPEWVKANGPYINGAYTESGENDYALLKITPLSKSVSGNLTPLRAQNTVPSLGSVIKAGAYPANVLGTKGVDAALRSQTEQLVVRDLLNFDGSEATPSHTELLETSASAIGQQGSSGGVVADQNNDILGLISNVVGSGNAAGTFIRALTVNGINKSLEQYSSSGLSGLILFGVDNLATSFNQSYRTSLTSIVSRALSL